MSAELCECGGNARNTGRPICPFIPGTPYRRIAVKTINSDGEGNFIDTADTLDEAYFTALLNNADPTKRWYPLPHEKNIEDVRAESIKEEFNDGSKYFVKSGTRASSGIMLEVGPDYIGVLEELRCGDYSIFEIDVNGSIIGMKVPGDDTKLYPMPMAKGTIDPLYSKQKDKELQKVMFNFEYSQSFLDKNIRQIKFGTDNGYSGIDLKTVDGLLAVHFAATPAAPDSSAKTMVIKLRTDYGDFGHFEPVTGLVIADFVSSDTDTASRVYNTTATADLTISSVTETVGTPGEYTIVTTTSFAVDDVLRIAIKKNGLDGAELSDGNHDLPAAVA